MKPLRVARLWVCLSTLLVLAALAAQAGGPLIVGGGPPPGFGVAGLPFRWNINPVTYWTDQGNLGMLTPTNPDPNLRPDTLVAQAFQVWENVPTATITFNAAGQLGGDVTSTNIMSVLNDLLDCNTGLTTIARERSIIYDVNGSIVQALGDDPNSVIGFASVLCTTTNNIDTNSFVRGIAVLNGKFIDGQPDSAFNPEISLDEFKTAFIHEFGHLIGLDHSQVNLNCLTGSPPCTADNLEGVPTMFPLLLGTAMMTPSTDDIAAVSELYPDPSFATTTGRIRGRIFFSDGTTHAQGYNVIARQVDNVATPQDESRRIAVSSVSGFLFTACVGNPVTPPPFNDCGPSITSFGSRDQSLIGFYDIPGLPPGSYTVEVEAIHNSAPQPFVAGSRVGPIGDLGFQFPLPPGTPPEFYSGAGETGDSATDDPTSASTLVVPPGSTQNDINIILNNTPPGLDAWETAWLRLLRQFWARADAGSSGSTL